MPASDSFATILAQRAAEDPQREAFVFLDRDGRVAEQRTRGALDAAARRIARELLRRGAAGAPVLLVFPPGLDFIDALFGCFYAGCAAVPAPYLMAKRAADRIAAICRNCRPALVLSVSRLENDAAVRGALVDDLAGLQIVPVDALSAGGPGAALPVPRPEDLALIQYTSGSTSEPRGVMLSHRNLVANSAMVFDAMGHGPDLRGVGWLPLFHDMGLIGHVLQPVYAGGLSVLMSPLTFLQRPVRWLQAISAWRATTSGGPSHAFALCTKMVSPEQAHALDLGSWRVAYCGSEPVRIEALEGFAERFAASGFRREALYPCYGLAEATLMVSGAPAPDGLHAAPWGDGGGAVASCGRPCRDLSVVIADSGRPVPDGTVGEIWVKGPSVAGGYWNQSGEGEAVFNAALAGGEGGFLRTGDLGFLRDGELFVVGRSKDLIVVRGLNHAPQDIEASVAASHRMFASLAGAAFAIDAAGEEQAVVVQEVRPPPDGGAALQAAGDAAFEAVTRDHGLRLYDLVLVRPGSIPRTSSGKVRRGRCREMYEAGEFARLDGAGAPAFLGARRAGAKT